MGVDNYVKLFQVGDIWVYLKNTMIMLDYGICATDSGIFVAWSMVLQIQV